MRRLLIMACVIAPAIAMTGCGDGESPSPQPRGRVGATQPPDVVQRKDGVAVVHLTSNDRMQFNADHFTVRSGETVRLVLEHVGRMPVKSMGHNVVILNRGESAHRFGREVFPNGGTPENEYLPPSMRGRVFAHTAMIGGGEQDVIEFVAPEPGDYPYVCTFPGHFASMTGRMTVQ